MGTYAGVELADLTLHGPRLDLRRWRPDDAARVHAVMQDPSMHRWFAYPFPYDPAAAQTFVTTAGHEGRDDGTGLGCALVERDTGRLVGAAALHLDNDPEIGFWTATDARGHGYAAEAARVLAGWAFAHGVPRVRILCDVRNLPSARSALRAGFRFEGVARNGGLGGDRRGDLAVFARVADDSAEPIAAAFPPLPDGGLTDGVIVVRPTVPEDAAGLLGCDDGEFHRWAFGPQRTTQAEAELAAARAGLDRLVGSSARCTIEDAATGLFAGELSVRYEGPPGVGAFGYAVHPSFRGRGYATRALRLAVPWCFEQVGFERLEIAAKAGNVASQRVALAAGFGPDGVRERRLRNADGTYSDAVCFVLLRPAAGA